MFCQAENRELLAGLFSFHFPRHGFVGGSCFHKGFARFVRCTIPIATHVLPEAYHMRDPFCIRLNLEGKPNIIILTGDYGREAN